MTVLGTVRMAERGMFIERDDGASPNVYLHPTIAKRGGLMAPFDGKRVRCEVSRDAFGNYAAVEIAELQLDDMEIPACDRGNVRLSAGEIRDLIELGWLDRSRSEDPEAVSDALSRLGRRALARRLTGRVRWPDPEPKGAA